MKTLAGLWAQGNMMRAALVVVGLVFGCLLSLPLIPSPEPETVADTPTVQPTDKPTARTVARPTARRVAQPTPLREWFQGGTLHEGTVADWKAGSAENKLATAGDWLSATDWKGHLNARTDFDRMRNKAQMLADGVDEVVPESPDSMKVNEIAAALLTMSDEFGP